MIYEGKWEGIGEDTHRLRVPTGWVMRVLMYKTHNPFTNLERKEYVGESLCFIFDPFHWWKP